MKSYRTRPIKRRRRGKEDIDIITDAMFDVVEKHRPMTVRQIFYQLVIAGVIEKTEAEYKGTVCRLLTDLRRAKVIPWGWITDYTRAMRKPKTYNAVEDAVEYTAQYYRRSLWQDQNDHVEIWLEKDALVGVLLEETWKYDVPLMVTRGYPSLSFLHGAGEEIEGAGKPTYIYYFGDHDPSGKDIPRTVEKGLRDFAPTAEINFEIVAVLPEQIEEFNLPTRPTKGSDTRSKDFHGDSVEVDAIPPHELRRICEYYISTHIEADALKVHEVAEESEQELLKGWAGMIRQGGQTP